MHPKLGSTARSYRSMVPAIPELLGIIQTFTNSNSTIPSICGSLENVSGEVIDGLSMYIVRDCQEWLAGWILRRDSLVEDVLRSLNEIRVIIIIVICVDVEINHMVPKDIHVSNAAGVIFTA